VTWQRHVVVVGASLAGLLAAAAAHRAGCRVTVLERDVLPYVPVPRRGVAQGEQPHVFLHRGLLAAEQLLPGLEHRLEADGAVRLNTGRLPWLGESGWNPIGDQGYDILSSTRPLLEHAVRREVAALPGVRILDGRRVEGVRRGDGGWLVALAEPGDGAAAGEPGEPGDVGTADVVVDASGRSSRLPTWLAALGVAAAPVSRVDAQLGYATRPYTGPAGSGVVVQATPQEPRGGLALPIESGGWLVAVVGFGDDRPPRDAEGFEAYVRGLRDPSLARQLTRWTPAGEVSIHRQTANVRHHYESVRDWPPGLLVVGDALCAFDPIYGQGVTVAACQALELGAALAGTGSGRASARASARGGTRGLQRRLAGVAGFPWAVATGADLRFPSTQGCQSRAQAVTNAWARQLGTLAAHGDLRAATTLSRTYHLMGSPLGLFHPALLVAAARGRLAGLPPANPAPAALGRASSSAA